MDPIVVAVIGGAFAVLVLAFIVWALVARASLRRARDAADAGWARVRGHLAERGDLVRELTGLVEHAAGYPDAASTSATNGARAAIEADSPAEAAAAEARLREAQRAVQHAASSFPQLLRSEDFLTLETRLREADDAGQAARREHNGAVREFNTKRTRFPASIFAGGPAFAPREFYEAEVAGAVAEPPRIQF